MKLSHLLCSAKSLSYDFTSRYHASECKLSASHGDDRGSRQHAYVASQKAHSRSAHALSTSLFLGYERLT
ncbi:hypothetical protein BD309DRAFT_970789 [Dichomitus squalens]|nr:hypothetical protein BD309DRAFT_970789 [Dichomitus squalens]